MDDEASAEGFDGDVRSGNSCIVSTWANYNRGIKCDGGAEYDS